MPTRRPRRSKRPPPELPGLIGRVDLDHRDALVVGAPDGADDAGGHGVLQAEGAADREDPVALAQAAVGLVRPARRRGPRRPRGAGSPGPGARRRSTTVAGTRRSSDVTSVTGRAAADDVVVGHDRGRTGSTITPLPWLPASVCTCTTVGATRDDGVGQVVPSAPTTRRASWSAAGVSTTGAGGAVVAVERARRRGRRPRRPPSTARPTTAAGATARRAAARRAAARRGGRRGRRVGRAAGRPLDGGRRGRTAGAVGDRGADRPRGARSGRGAQRREPLGARPGLEGREAVAHEDRLYRAIVKVALG